MEFDIGIFRGLLTLMLMVGFIGICVWAYSPRQKKDFDKASLLPFENSGDDLKKEMPGKKENSTLKSENSLNE